MWLPLLLLQGTTLVAGLALRGGDDEPGDAPTRSPRAPLAARTGVYYAAERLDRLRASVRGARLAVEQRQGGGLQELAAAASRLQNGSTDRTALEAALRFGRQQGAAAEAAALEALEFYHTARAMLGARGGAPSCRFLACGPHAACALRGGRARCECEQCFQGDGFTCSPASCGPSAAPSAVPLLGQSPPGYPTVQHTTPQGVEELQLAVFAHDRVAVAVRASAAGDRGFLIVGRVEGGGVAWGPWQAFSAGTGAFGPVLAGLPSGRLVLAYRDGRRRGTGYMVGGQLSAAGAPRASLRAPRAFARGQSRRMALVPLASSRAACLYAGGEGTARPFGGIALVQSLAGGALGVLGRYRFSDGRAVARLAAAALGPAAFVVAFSAAPDPSLPPGQASRELSAAWVGMRGGELVVGPRPLELEPARAGMRARGLALVSQGLLAYSYESASERRTKVAIVRVDPATHALSLAGGPRVIAEGRAAYVQGVSLPSGPASPKTFTYLQHPGGNGVGKVCGVSAAGRVIGCKDVMWADAELKAVSGSRLPDGRLVFAFSDTAGKPFYQMLDAADSGTQET